MGDNLTVKTLWLLEASVLGFALAAGAGCSSTGSSTNTEALPADVQAITFLQRTPRNDDGNVFDYNNFVAGGRLVMLSPPSANGKLTVVFPNEATCTEILGAGAASSDIDNCVSGSDVQSYDLSFDAKSVVMSAQVPAAGDTSYQLYSINLDGTNLRELTSGGNDFVYPVYAPGDQVLFMTNRNVEADTDSSSQQFKDEYERAVTAQAGTISTSGTNMQLGPRNVSHRVSPQLLPDGHVMYTEWMHMGEVNEGHLRLMNTDMTGMKEAFGDELAQGNPSTNSYLKARYVTTTQYFDQSAGKMIDNYQVVAIATSRDRTLQSGKLFLINLNGSEANSTSQDLTPLIPGDRSPSSQGIGRYYDAEPVGDEAPGQFLASWSDGPVQSEELDRAQSTAQFGIYVFDMAHATASNGGRSPIYDNPNYWDILARPVKVRAEPMNLPSPIPLSTTDKSTTIGALNVYNSSLMTIPQGSVVKVRLIEGFSGEEGGVDMFGTTEFDGQSKYGEVPLQSDGSFMADVPANVPLHIQLVDKFGMAVGVSGSHGTAADTPVANEDIWISGRAGESRTCGGCHENRTAPSSITPGETIAASLGPMNLDTPRPQRVSTTAYVLDPNGNLPAGTNAANPGDNGVRGVPWDLAIQPILDKHCVSCHDGTAGPQNPQYTVTDMTTGTSQTFIFDLRGQKLNVTVGERMTGDFTASYISIMGLGEILGDDVVQITGTPPNYVQASAAEASSLMTQYLNPPQRYPTVDMNTRLTTVTPHLLAQGQPDMTADEYYLIGLNIDMGGQYFFRENLDEAGATP